VYIVVDVARVMFHNVHIQPRLQRSGCCSSLKRFEGHFNHVATGISIEGVDGNCAFVCHGKFLTS
jgi:hypothetical protein